jgi:hypothetical protein
MLLPFLKRFAAGPRNRTSRPARPSRRFRLEQLEDRLALSAFTTNIVLQAPYAGASPVANEVNSTGGTGTGLSYTANLAKNIATNNAPTYATGGVLLTSYATGTGGGSSLGSSTHQVVLTYSIQGTSQVPPNSGAAATGNFSIGVFGIYDIGSTTFSTLNPTSWGPGTPGAILLYTGSLIPATDTQQGTSPPGDPTFAGQPLVGQNQANFFAASGAHAPGAFIAHTNGNAANALNLLFAPPNPFDGFQAEVDELNALATVTYASLSPPTNGALNTNFALVAGLDPLVSFTSLTPFTDAGGYAPTSTGANGDTLQKIGITLFPVTVPADVRIKKTDSVGGAYNSGTNNTTGGTVVAGKDNTVTYTIVVTNDGPNTAFYQTVTDNNLTTIATSDSWTAVASAGSSVATASGTGNISDIVNLQIGGTVTFTVTATIHPDPSATAGIVNVASVTLPNGDTTPGDNTSTDTITPVAVYDLAITKKDNVGGVYNSGTNNTTGGTVVAGKDNTVVYTIVVSNSGPSTAVNQTVTDNNLTTIATSDSWTAVASAGSSVGTPSGSGNISDSVTLLPNGTVTFTVTAHIAPVADSTASIVNVASVSNDTSNPTTPADNTSTDTITPVQQADLSITKKDNVGGVYNSGTNNTTGGTVTAGQDNTVVYTIVVTNAGPDSAVNQTVTDNNLTTIATSDSWTAVASAGSSVTTTSGTGNISDTITVLPGGTVTFTVTAHIAPASGSTAAIVNTASVTLPPGDTTPNNNTSTDTITPAPGSPVGPGEFATIGFWHNKNGQAVINSFNGGSSSTALGNWLASNFPNLFGTLAGDTNSQVAAAYLVAFGNVGGVQGNTYVQAFAVALGVYADTASLGFNSTAAKYGFISVPGGGGNLTFNIGSNGAAFGVPNNTSLTVFQILTAANNNYNPVTGLFYGGDQTKTSDLNNVLDGINTTGDIK